MNQDIAQLLAESAGVVCRDQVLARAPHHVLDHHLVTGELARVHPGTFTRTEAVSDRRIRRLAALRYGGENAALSHRSALEMWDLVVPAASLHILVERNRRLRGSAGLVVHTRAGFEVAPPEVVVRDGLATVRLERSLVDSWPMLPPEAGRPAVIAAVQGRLTTASRVQVALRDVPNLPRRVQLGRLLDLLDQGQHSELEIWGHRQVFDHPSLPPGRRQLPVRLPYGACYLDLAYRPELVDVEMDGAAFHFGRWQRERDMRRDAALGALGWVVLRFSSVRLREDPEGVRCELLRVLEMRRRQLGLDQSRGRT